jgi:peptidyl-prolyl cis-trans isomerase B (cyclophilin B)
MKKIITLLLSATMLIMGCAACGDKEEAKPSAKPTQTEKAEAPAEPTEAAEDLYANTINFTIEMEDGGIMKGELYPDLAPITVENFVNLAEDKFYDGLIFHRVISGFMIQGGGFDQSFTQKPTDAPIKNEAANQISNRRGTIAMARTAIVDSATCQFFINLVDNSFLDFRAPTQQHYGYCVFGEVVEGMDVVDAIAKVKTGNRGMHADVPVENVVINKAEITED